MLNIINLGKKFLHFMGNWRTDQTTDGFGKIRIRLFNFLLSILLSLQFFLFFRELLTWDTNGIIINGTALTFTFVMAILHKYCPFKYAAFYSSLVYPCIICTAGVVMGEFDGLNYFFFIYIITAIFFHEKTYTKLLFIGLVVGLFVFGGYYIENFPRLLPAFKNNPDHNLFFVCAVIIISLIVFLFHEQIGNSERRMQKFLVSLQRNNDQLNWLNKELERFTHAASHDMKTPLRSIVSFTTLMERALKNKDYDKLEEYFTYVKTGALQMNDLVKNTLEYSTLDASNVLLEDISLNAIVDEIKEKFAQDSITIIRTELPDYVGNKNLIFKVLYSIVENGLKYNDSPQKVIQISYQEESEFYVLKISDNGIGIDSTYFKEIFTHFKRLHTSFEFEGSGLGLTICKKIINQFGGEIWVQSELKKGSQFYIKLPVTPQVSVSSIQQKAEEIALLN